MKEQQKISTEWMKISKERDLMDKEKSILKKEKLKLSKQQNDTEKELNILMEERKNLNALHKKWKNETSALLNEIDQKYSAFNNVKDKNNEKYTEQRRLSLENHVEALQNLTVSTPIKSESFQNLHNQEESNNFNMESADIDAERLKLRKMQKAAKVCFGTISYISLHCLK